MTTHYDPRYEAPEVRQRPSQARRDTPPPRTPQGRYQHGALTAAEAYGAAIWLAVWVINAYFTISMVQLLGLAWWVGIPIHLSVSFVEQHLWQARRWGAWALVLIASFVDLFSSAWGVQTFLVARGAPIGVDNWIASAVYTVLALIIALAPERAGVGHIFAFTRLLKRRTP